jgi:hypothetical protein
MAKFKVILSDGSDITTEKYDSEESLREYLRSQGKDGFTIARAENASRAEQLRSEAADLQKQTEEAMKLGDFASSVENAHRVAVPSADRLANGPIYPSDAIRAGMEVLTTPFRLAGAGINALAGDDRGGLYGIDETQEQAGKNAGTVRSFLQKLLHDPMNAVPTAKVLAPVKNIRALEALFGPAASTGTKVAGNVASTGGEAAAREVVRPAVVEEAETPDAGDLALAAGTSALGEFLGFMGRKGLQKAGEKISATVPGLTERLAFENKITPQALDMASTKEGRAALANAWGVRTQTVDDLAELFTDWGNGRRLKELSQKEKEALAALDAQGVTVDLAPEKMRMLGLGDKALEKSGSAAHGPNAQKANTEIEREAKTVMTPKAARQRTVSALVDEHGQPITVGDPNASNVRPVSQANEVKRNMQYESQSNYKKADNYDDLAGRELETSAKNVRKAVREAIAANDSPEAQAALEAVDQMAAMLQARDNARDVLAVGNTESTIRGKINSALSNLYSTNSIKNEDKRRVLAALDKAYGTDFLKKAEQFSSARLLAPNGHPEEAPWLLANYNKWGTGRTPRSQAKFVPEFIAGKIDDMRGYSPKGAAKRVERRRDLGEGLQAMGNPNGSLSSALSLLFPRLYLRPTPEGVPQIAIEGVEQPQDEQTAQRRRDTLRFFSGAFGVPQ